MSLEGFVSMVRVVESFFGVKGMMLRGFLSLYVRVLNRALRVWAEEVRRVEGARRNGWRDRWLLTPFGWVRVRMPKFRRGVRTPCPLFERYSRFSRGFSVLVVLLYFSGVSLRGISELYGAFGQQVSHQGIASVLRRFLSYWSERLSSWPIRGTPFAMVLDGVWVRVKGVGKAVFLVAVGVFEDGSRRVLGYRLSRGESYGSWRGFLRGLIERGLCARGVRLVVHDGVVGLRGAVRELFPFASSQLCVWHLVEGSSRRISDPLGRGRFKRALYWLYRSRGPDEFWRRYLEVKGRLKERYPSAWRVFERKVDETLEYFSFPCTLWGLLKYTNVAEQLFGLMRWRMFSFKGFENRASAMRLAAAAIGYHMTPNS